MNPSGLTFGIVSLAMVVIATIPDRERQPPPAAPGGTQRRPARHRKSSSRSRSLGTGDGRRRQRHAVPRGFRRRRRAAREVGGRRQGSGRAGSGQPARRLRHASAFRPHGWLPGSDSHAVGPRTARAAGGLRPGRHQGDDRALLEAYRADFETRTKDRGLYTVGAFPEGHAVNAHEIRRGVVYKDANVTVTAFATKHAMESYRLSVRHRRSQHRHLRRYQPHPGDDRRLPWL